MNWKLILQLSLFGLAMGIATVFVIPSKIEPAFWLVIFLFCAYWIARHCPSLHFLHGLLLGLANSVWITAAHVLFYDAYIARHAPEAEIMHGLAASANMMKLVMTIIGPVVGLVSGVILGLFALIAGKLFKNPPVPTPNATA
jgi:hypothetical protein